MKRFVGLLIMIGLLLLLALPVPISAQETVYFPETGWRSSTPEAQGMDSGKLAALLESVQSGFSFDSILVLRHGSMVLDASTFPFSAEQPHDLFSVTKSVVSTLVGIAIDKGYIKGVDQSIWDFFSPAATANMDARKQAITIENLLTQASGLQITTGMDVITDDMRMYTLTASDPSWVQFVLDHPMSVAPGTSWGYLDANAHLVSAIVQKATGMTTLAFAQQYLFGPLGITDASWQSDPQGVNTGGDELFLSPYDMAKLGSLYLQEGMWDGQQIVSPSWIATATSIHNQTGIPIRPNYGYFWWINTFGSHKGYAAIGLGGQYILVIPDLDMVIVLTGDTGNEMTLMDSYILPALQSDTALPGNPQAQARLHADIDALAHPAAIVVPTLPATAQQISGKVFTLSSNNLGWQSIAFDFTGETATIRLGVNDSTLELPVGLDGVYRISTVGLPRALLMPVADVPLATKGTWRTDRLFVFSVADLKGMQEWAFTVNFNPTTGRFTGRAASSVTTQTFSINGRIQ